MLLEPTGTNKFNLEKKKFRYDFKLKIKLPTKNNTYLLLLFLVKLVATLLDAFSVLKVVGHFQFKFYKESKIERDSLPQNIKIFTVEEN